MPVCDICSRPINFADGYSLATKEVVLTTAYWTTAFRGGLATVHQLDPMGGDQLMHYIEQQAAQHTGWLVCEGCSTPLRFDRPRARQLAARQQNPPEAGPVAPREVARYAADAWKKLYGSAPRLTKFSDVIISTNLESGDTTVFRPEESTRDKGQTPSRKWWQVWKRRP